MGTTADKLQAVLSSKVAIKEALATKRKNPTNVLSTYAGLIDDITDVTFADPLKLTDVWQYSHDNTIRAIAVDADGYSYSGGNGKTVRKLTPTGEEVWSFAEHTNWVYGIAIDADGFIYSVGGDKRIFKLSPNGTKVAEYMNTISLYDIKVGPDGFIYVGCAGGSVLKLTTSLTLEKKLSPHSIDVNGVAVASDGSIYTASADGNIRKTSQDGTQIWNFDADASTAYYIAIDHEGFIYGAYAGDVIVKLAPDGTEIWRITMEKTPLKLCVDSMNHIYSAGYSGYIYKISPDDGSLIWTHRPHTSTINALAVGNNYIYSGGGSRLKKTDHCIAVAGTAYAKPESGKPIPQNIVKIMGAQAIEVLNTDQVIPAGTFLSGDLTIKKDPEAFAQKTYVVTNSDGTQRAYAVLASEEPVTLTATPNDIRTGTSAITNGGYTEGEKDIPAYHTHSGTKIVQAGEEATIAISVYDYTKIQATLSTYNTSISDSVEVTASTVGDSVYEAGTTTKLADITKDDETQTIKLGITAEEKSVLRYFIMKEES